MDSDKDLRRDQTDDSNPAVLSSNLSILNFLPFDQYLASPGRWDPQDQSSV